MSDAPNSVGDSQVNGILPQDWSERTFPSKVSAILQIVLPALPQFTVDMAYTHLHNLHEWTHKGVTEPMKSVADKIFDWTEARYGSNAAERVDNIVQSVMREFRFTRRYPHVDDYGFSPSVEKLAVLALETMAELSLMAVPKALGPVVSLAGRVYDWTVTQRLSPVVSKIASLAQGFLSDKASTLESYGLPVSDLWNRAVSMAKDNLYDPVISGVSRLFGLTSEEPAPEPA